MATVTQRGAVQRFDEANDHVRDLMETLDTIGQDAGLTRSQWLAEVKETLEGMVERYDEWTEMFEWPEELDQEEPPA